MNFPAPVDTYTLRGRGTVYITHIPVETTRGALENLVGETVTLGGRLFHVSGVETYLISRQKVFSPFGLLGEYVNPPNTEQIPHQAVSDSHEAPQACSAEAGGEQTAPDAAHAPQTSSTGSAAHAAINYNIESGANLDRSGAIDLDGIIADLYAIKKRR